jgi:hypothetical protein
VVARGVATGEFRDRPAARHPEVLLGPAIMAALWTMRFDRLEPLDLDGFTAAHLDVVLAAAIARRPEPRDSPA